jgi:hypothetical protein
VPAGLDHLEPAALELYRQEMDALMPAMQRGSAGEDDSNGYALGTDAELRKIQIALRTYALERGQELETVLRASADAQQRMTAAALLGYARRSPAQIRGLIDAILDPDSEVRNNAMRALVVLTSVKDAQPIKISVKPLEALLVSGQWSDRNKASLLLDQLTTTRDPQLLHELRAAVLDVLIEGASWHGDPGQADAFVILLGRIANMPEEQILRAPRERGLAEMIEKARRAD